MSERERYVGLRERNGEGREQKEGATSRDLLESRVGKGKDKAKNIGA